MDVPEHTKIEIDPELYMLKTYDDNAIVSNIKKIVENMFQNTL